MKSRLTFFTLLLVLVMPAFTGFNSFSQEPKSNDYIIITWNDLGMHCSNKDFSKLTVLPPYNNLTAYLIKKGNASTPPEILTTGYTVNYGIPGNTYSVGKTNFWSYENLLFGVNLPDNVGLTGATLSGQMGIRGNSFFVDGVPLTPYTDANLVTEDPYQLALVKAYDGNGILLATTQNVIPVSNEMNCVSSGCHSSEADILGDHKSVGGFNPNNTPILCANCHSSNALGMPGVQGVPSLSQAIHNKHKNKTNDCYKCHPGPNAQCLRDVMHATGMVCQDCHGSVANVALTIQNGRQPWLQEPSCGAVACHGPTYAEEPGKLYRNSKGHGGLYCSTCHGSPHAILPSENDRDNVQNIALQGFAGTLRDCSVCHGITPEGAGPHGYNPQPGSGGQDFIVVAWNDLGMHCANKDFSKIVVLPPYNNLKAEVIRKGTETSWPEVVTTGYEVTYEIPGNTYSVGKTNFWSYENLLFGVNLPSNIGLTGAGLSGNMAISGKNFFVDGIPITPYTDANLVTEDPYQLALIKAFDGTGKLIASTQPVIPVSNEINCVSSGCHSSEVAILNAHKDEGGFNPNNTPILCASCHGSNALGLPGTPGLGSFSEVIHDKHKNKTNDCYKCHPGPNTQCYRDVMHTAGMVCQDCHGSVANVALTIENGRQPWLQEPSCGSIQCHGPAYAENTGKLFRNSKGHGGLYCSTCHGSPHAIVPTTNDRDNVQNIALQGYKGTLNNCAVCHGYIPAGAGPHGLPGPAVTVQNIELPGGWSGISSYLMPMNKEVNYIFEPVIDNFILMTNNNQVYWPDQAINTINTWNTSQGYIIKMTNPDILTFKGIVEASKSLSLSAGWSIMPVLSSCVVSVEQLFAAYPGQLVMVKEVAGWKVYWPGKGINSLQTLAPGKSYFVLTNNPLNIVFPNCFK